MGNGRAKWLVAVVLVGFAAFSGWVALHDPTGVFTVMLREWWAAQFAVDLYIAVAIAWVFILRAQAPEARSRAWPWVIASAGVGSLALLGYLLVGRPARSA